MFVLLLIIVVAVLAVIVGVVVFNQTSDKSPRSGSSISEQSSEMKDQTESEK